MWPLPKFATCKIVADFFSSPKIGNILNKIGSSATQAYIIVYVGCLPHVSLTVHINLSKKKDEKHNSRIVSLGCLCLTQLPLGFQICRREANWYFHTFSYFAVKQGHDFELSPTLVDSFFHFSTLPLSTWNKATSLYQKQWGSVACNM